LPEIDGSSVDNNQEIAESLTSVLIDSSDPNASDSLKETVSGVDTKDWVTSIRSSVTETAIGSRQGDGGVADTPVLLNTLSSVLLDNSADSGIKLPACARINIKPGWPYMPNKAKTRRTKYRRFGKSRESWKESIRKTLLDEAATEVDSAPVVAESDMTQDILPWISGQTNVALSRSLAAVVLENNAGPAPAVAAPALAAPKIVVEDEVTDADVILEDPVPVPGAFTEAGEAETESYTAPVMAVPGVAVPGVILPGKEEAAFGQHEEILEPAEETMVGVPGTPVSVLGTANFAPEDSESHDENFDAEPAGEWDDADTVDTTEPEEPQIIEEPPAIVPGVPFATPESVTEASFDPVAAAVQEDPYLSTVLADFDPSRYLNPTGDIRANPSDEMPIANLSAPRNEPVQWGNNEETTAVTPIEYEPISPDLSSGSTTPQRDSRAVLDMLRELSALRDS